MDGFIGGPPPSFHILITISVVVVVVRFLNLGRVEI
jgi:hypothetical protein